MIHFRLPELEQSSDQVEELPHSLHQELAAALKHQEELAIDLKQISQHIFKDLVYADPISKLKALLHHKETKFIYQLEDPSPELFFLLSTVVHQQLRQNVERGVPGFSSQGEHFFRLKEKSVYFPQKGKHLFAVGVIAD